jgi:DNA (cytosine-5)-methyltransferase 1
VTHGRRKQDLPVISLFSGALGLDLGLERAGFRIAVCVECNRDAAATIRRNRPRVPVLQRPIEDLSTDEILEAAGLRPGQAALVTGGPSCQVFSTVGQRGSLGDPRGSLFKEFLRVVREARPSFFVMENVKGILSAAVRHRPLAERGPGYPPLRADEELGSAFARILNDLRALDYYVAFDLLNAADYGTPQTRERIVFIGSRDGKPVTLPSRTHGSGPDLTPWVTLREALAGLCDPDPLYTALGPKKKRFLALVPPGGNWRDLPRRLQRRALGGAYHSWGGRSGFFRRLSWDRPAHALTTKPDSSATMACHPTELRPLSVREYARLQQFPDRWQLEGPMTPQYRQVGNAVPVGLGKKIGKAILAAAAKRARRARLGTFQCETPELLNRLSRRPKTVLNPPRMRKVKSMKALRTWLGKGERGRRALQRALAGPRSRRRVRLAKVAARRSRS